jgi:hypothetical protein
MMFFDFVGAKVKKFFKIRSQPQFSRTQFDAQPQAFEDSRAF